METMLFIIVLSITLTWFLTQGIRCPVVDTRYDCICDTGDNPDRIGGWTQICFTGIYGIPDTAYEMTYSRSGILRINCESVKNLMSFLFVNLTSVNRFHFINCEVGDSFYKLVGSRQVTELLYRSRKQQISNIFDSMYDLKVLILSRNKLAALLPNVFRDLRSLNDLNLSQNELVHISSNVFSNLHNLNTLSLSRNRLVTVPENSISHLKKLKSLFLSRNYISDLPPSLLKNLSDLEILDISYNKIVKLSEDFLSGQQKLKRFEVRFNKMEEIPPSLLKKTVELRVLDISSNPLLAIPENLLHELESLAVFLASSCNLTAISQHMFAKNSNLKEVKLNGNRFREFPSDLFRNNFELKKIDLSDNPLESIDARLFSSQAQLEWLSLARCRLENLPENLFATAFELNHLDLSSNLLTQLQPNFFKNLIRLVNLNLKNNMIQHINGSLPFGMSRTLKTVDLSRNNVNFISNNIQWENYLKLELLNLGYNRLTNFSVPLIYSEKVSVLLGHNNITTIAVQALLLLQKTLDLFPIDQKKSMGPMFLFHPNPLKCDCFLYEFAKLATSYFRMDDNPPVAMFPLASHLTCQSPEHLKGRKLSDVKFDEFRCNVTYNCPENCSCYRQASDSVTVVDCHSKRLNSYPTLLPANTTIVHFENNSFSDLTPLMLSLLENCTEIHLAGNQIRSLQDLHFSRNLKRITLNDNRLTSLWEFMEATTDRPDIRASLSGNPYKCDCNDDVIVFLLEKHPNIEDLDNLRCHVSEDGTVLYTSSCFITNKSGYTYQFQTMLFVVLLVILGSLLVVFIHHWHYLGRTAKTT